MDRLFLDANVFFSAAYRPDSGLLRLWALEDVELLTSAYALEEARANLQAPEQYERLEQLARYVEVIAFQPSRRPLPREVSLPGKDHPILLAAAEAGATHLLTGDVKHFGPYYGRSVEGVTILAPAEYLRTRPGR